MRKFVLSTFLLILVLQYIDGRFEFNFERNIRQAAEGAQRDVGRDVVHYQKKMEKIKRKLTEKAVDPEAVGGCIKELQDEATEEINEQNANAEDCIGTLKENMQGAFADQKDFWAIITVKRKFKDEIKKCKGESRESMKKIFKKYEEDAKACAMA